MLSCAPMSPPFVWRAVAEGDALLAVEAEVCSLVPWLPRDLREPAARILLSGRRIAQEWVGLEVLSALDHVV